MTAKDIDDSGKYDLFDANTIIGKTNNTAMSVPYITIIKDGAGVGRIRKLPENSAFIGTMGALTNRDTDLDFIFALLSIFNLNSEFSGSTIPHIYFKDYGNNDYLVPYLKEQVKIGVYFKYFDCLITLHQREQFYTNKDQK